MHESNRQRAAARIPLALVLAVAALSAHAEVYRCQTQGVTRFSDVPCGDDAEVLPPRQPNLLPAADAESLADRYDRRVEAYGERRAEEDAQLRKDHAARRAKEARLREARRKGVVVPGMSAASVRGLRGVPSDVRHERNGDKLREVWVYAGRGRKRETVTFESGEVIQVRGASKKAN